MLKTIAAGALLVILGAVSILLTKPWAAEAQSPPFVGTPCIIPKEAGVFLTIDANYIFVQNNDGEIRGYEIKPCSLQFVIFRQ